MEINPCGRCQAILEIKKEATDFWIIWCPRNVSKSLRVTGSKREHVVETWNAQNPIKGE